MTLRNTQTVAVIGAGFAGATCARALSLAGYSVHVFDKSRGLGGRLATRRVEWIDRLGQSCITPFDHGAPGITVHSADFQAFLEQNLGTGRLTPWTPSLAANSLPLEDGDKHYLPVSDMPSVCRYLLDGVSTTWSFAVERLHRCRNGWQVEADGTVHAELFDAVVLALPPAQAAPLLSPHRHDWAQQAEAVRMQPCWTLLGISDDAEPALAWDLAQPPTGPLAWVMRNDRRPGRAPKLGQAHWVAHAHADWSREHLEQSAAWIEQQMCAALDLYLGHPLVWHHRVVHRWRYAMAESPSAWDGTQGLGVCGDFLGGKGVEGVWRSAQSLCAAMLAPAVEPDAANVFASAERNQIANQQPMT